MKKILIPLVSQNLRMSVDKHEIEAFVKSKSSDKQQNSDIFEALADSVGITITLNGDDDRKYRIIGVFDGKKRTLYHEAVHYAWDVLDGCSIPASPESHEMLAYMVEFIIHEFDKRFELE